MEINVQQPWYTAIANGKKTVEGRLNKGKFADIRPGSVLVLNGSLRSKKMVLVVHGIAKYKSFEEYLSQEGLRQTLPGVKTIKEGVEVYRGFYSTEDESMHGVLAIRFHVAK
jgi:ASC-1-like (ASCH) protein